MIERRLLQPLLALALLCGADAQQGVQLTNRDRQLAPARWWCRDPSHAESMFCKTAVLKEAIAVRTHG